VKAKVIASVAQSGTAQDWKLGLRTSPECQ
jgi:hypothetical protein